MFLDYIRRKRARFFVLLHPSLRLSRRIDFLHRLLRLHSNIFPWSGILRACNFILKALTSQFRAEIHCLPNTLSYFYYTYCTQSMSSELAVEYPNLSLVFERCFVLWSFYPHKKVCETYVFFYSSRISVPIWNSSKCGLVLRISQRNPYRLRSKASTPFTKK